MAAGEDEVSGDRPASATHEQPQQHVDAPSDAITTEPSAEAQPSENTPLTPEPGSQDEAGMREKASDNAPAPGGDAPPPAGVAASETTTAVNKPTPAKHFRLYEQHLVVANLQVGVLPRAQVPGRIAASVDAAAGAVAEAAAQATATIPMARDARWWWWWWWWHLHSAWATTRSNPRTRHANLASCPGTRLSWRALLALAWSGNVLLGEWLLPWAWIATAPTPHCTTAQSCLLVLADPQLTDAHSYHQRPGWALWATQAYADGFMWRSFGRVRAWYAGAGGQHVLFLGDLMDGGREWGPDQEGEFQAEKARFDQIFRVSSSAAAAAAPVTLAALARRPTTMSPPSHLHYHYMAGNHDVGFGPTLVPYAYARFERTFGRVNYVFDLHRPPRHTLVGGRSRSTVQVVVVDTVGLSDPNRDAPHHRAARALLDSVRVEDGTERILFTHVPLYRPEGSACGPLRRHPPLTNRKGYQYQNMLSLSLSQELLERIRPAIILSGDDHDACVYTHAGARGQPIEYTVPTFSWLQGQLYPGYAVVSLPPDDGGRPRVDIYYLLPPLLVYMWYIACFVGTLVLVGWVGGGGLPKRAGARRARGGGGGLEGTSLLPVPMTLAHVSLRRGSMHAGAGVVRAGIGPHGGRPRAALQLLGHALVAGLGTYLACLLLY